MKCELFRFRVLKTQVSGPGRLACTLVLREIPMNPISAVPSSQNAAGTGIDDEALMLALVYSKS
jgi:hypothetical protein